MNTQLAKRMRGFEDKFPLKLDEQFSRIVEKIVELWRSPERLNAYFQELTIADHHERQGFPPEIASELFSLANVYEKILELTGPDDDILQHENAEAKDQRDNLKNQFSAQSFFNMLSDGSLSGFWFMQQSL